MLSADYDKENTFQGNRMPAASAAQGKGSSSGKSFSKLLKDASNNIREENDKQVAINITTDEAVDMIREWIQANEDHELAQKLTKSYKEELLLQQKIELEQGEKEALRLAIEETRRAKALKEERQNRENQDAKLAQELYQAEAKDVEELKRVCADDAKIARRLGCPPDHVVAARQKAEEKISYNQNPMRNARILSRGSKVSVDDDSDSADEKEDDSYREEKADDIEGVRGQLLKHSTKKEEKTLQIQRDRELARRTQEELDRAARYEDEDRNQHDYYLSQRLAVRSEREAHRMNKFKELQKSFAHSKRDEETVEYQWENALAEVEDVAGGVCITIFLPNVAAMSVKAVKASKKVCIDAKRLVASGSDTATKDNSRYVAEFYLRGIQRELRDAAVSYEYSSESGLLHVYIDGVTLEYNARAAKQASTSGKITPHYDSSNGDAVDVDNDDFIVKYRNNPYARLHIAKAMANGFRRLLGGSSGSNKEN